MVDPLADMTQAKWSALSQAEREKIKDRSGLHPKLLPFLGKYVEVRPKREAPKHSRFVVGISTGWRPVLLAIRNGGFSSSDTIGVDEVFDTITVTKPKTPKGR